MTTKLTLTIQEDVIKTAKKYAATNGSSLSGIVENYLKTLRVIEPKKVPVFSPKVKKLKGIISLPGNFDYKKLLAEEITKKHSNI
jgi:hypothetical protein